MKRLLHLVVPALAALLLAQPLLAYASCGQSACAGQSCAPVCCDGMAGMNDTLSAACHAPLQAAPAGALCGQSSDAPALSEKDSTSLTATAGAAPHAPAPALALSLPPAIEAAQAAPGPSAEPSAPGPDRTILFHIFRI